MNAIATVQQKPDVNKLLAKVSDTKLSFGERVNSIGDVMRAMSHQMMAALPKHLTPDRMIRVALNNIRKNPKLLDCTAASLFGAITEAATYGWEIGGIHGHAYLVPFKDECQLIPGYKGLIDLCRRSGQISTISMEVVHKGDEFRYSLGDNPHIHHQPNDNDPKRDSQPITHVYAVVKLRDGGIQRSVWSQAKVDAHKEQYSQAWKRAEASKKRDSFWHTAWPAAAKKTVIRDMINRGLLPVSAEYRDVVQRGIQHEQHDEPVMGFDAFDAIATPTPAAIEGPVEESQDAKSDLDELAVMAAREAFTAATDEQGVSFEAESLLKHEMSEATRKAIEGEAELRIKTLRRPEKGKTQKQLA